MDYGSGDLDFILTVWDGTTPRFQVPIYLLHPPGGRHDPGRLWGVSPREMTHYADAIVNAKGFSAAASPAQPATILLVQARAAGAPLDAVTVDVYVGGRRDLALRFEAASVGMRLHDGWQSKVHYYADNWVRKHITDRWGKDWKSIPVYPLSLTARSASVVVGRAYGRHLTRLKDYPL